MTDLVIDAATASWIGARDRQEDALLTHLGPPGEPGLILLSDGMGGHGDGDIASRTIVSGMLADLFRAACRPEALRRHGPAILRRALATANDRLRRAAHEGAGQEGMGGTLVTGLVLDGNLRWISVGDSPLYLLRQGVLSRLNADHSLAPQIDMMVARGDIDAETARQHPQRAVLTSALTGGEIARVDCPEAALALAPGDVLLFASDGIGALTAAEIGRLLRPGRGLRAQPLADRLMRAVRARAAEDQDNVTLAVLTVRGAPRPGIARPPLPLGALLRRQAMRLRPGGLRP